MIKSYRFLVELKDGKRRIKRMTSKHLNGAIRKLYQTFDIERIVKIIRERMN